MHEPVTTGISRQIIEKCAYKLPILWQDRPDDDACTIAQVHDVNKLGGIAMNLVSYHIHGVRSDHGIDLGPAAFARHPIPALGNRFTILEKLLARADEVTKMAS